jgi:hypothetical protein
VSRRFALAVVVALLVLAVPGGLAAEEATPAAAPPAPPGQPTRRVYLAAQNRQHGKGAIGIAHVSETAQPVEKVKHSPK